MRVRLILAEVLLKSVYVTLACWYVWLIYSGVKIAVCAYLDVSIRFFEDMKKTRPYVVRGAIMMLVMNGLLSRRWITSRMRG